MKEDKTIPPQIIREAGLEPLVKNRRFISSSVLIALWLLVAVGFHGSAMGFTDEL
jgi:hypothetical protein